MTYYNRDNIFNLQPRLIGSKGETGITGDTGSFLDSNGDLNMNNNQIIKLTGITFTGNTLNITSNSIDDKSKSILFKINEFTIIGETNIGFTDTILLLRNGTTNITNAYVEFANPIGYTIDENNPYYYIGKRFDNDLRDKFSIWKHNELNTNNFSTNVVTIDKNNFIGINTNNPSCPLEINSVNDNTYLRVGSVNALRSIYFNTIDSNGHTHIINASSTSGNIIFQTNSIDRLRLSNGSNIAINNTDNILGATLDINGNSIRLRNSNTPTSSSAHGNTGEIRWDDNYVYIRVSDQWKRALLSNI
jgi:hypothetical protein